MVDNYMNLTSDKYNSLGKTMTLKDALDLWWNSVRVRTKDGVRLCYKCHDGDYELCDLSLNLTITLDDEWDEDADGYPIVWATPLRITSKLVKTIEKSGNGLLINDRYFIVDKVIYDTKNGKDIPNYIFDFAIKNNLWSAKGW